MDRRIVSAEDVRRCWRRECHGDDHLAKVSMYEESLCDHAVPRLEPDIRPNR
jgi:hypothetical protein